MKTIRIIFNKDYLASKKGDEIDVEVDGKNIPLSPSIRKLLKSSEIDGTISVKKPVKTPKTETKKSKKTSGAFNNV